MEKPNFEKIGVLLKERESAFSAFYRLLTEYNTKYNLTAITAEKEAYFKHFYDSLAGIELFPQGAQVLEVGSGAGFPSIPLKLVREDLCFTLVESTGKKCEFLRAAKAALSLTNLEVINVRAEELGTNPRFREKFDVVCARAVARLDALVEYCMPLLRVGGVMIAYKGDAEEEIKGAEGAIRLLGGERAESVRYELPENFGVRTLVRIKKIRKTPEKYPRKNAQIKREPLS